MVTPFHNSWLDEFTDSVPEPPVVEITIPEPAEVETTKSSALVVIYGYGVGVELIKFICGVVRDVVAFKFIILAVSGAVGTRATEPSGEDKNNPAFEAVPTVRLFDAVDRLGD
jgi:hypothetical protein